MWVPKHNAHLGLRCSKCNAELEGELSESQGYSETTIVVVVECNCTEELEQKITELAKELAEIEEENNAKADG